MYRYLVVVILFFLVACSGQSKEELVQEGNQLRDQGNYRGAIVLYKSALEKDANFIAARRQLGEAYLISGDLEKAKNELVKVLLQNPGETDVLLSLAKVHLQKREPEQALLELDKFHAAHAETAESLVLYGLAHGAGGDLTSAETFFNKALELDEQSVDARINLAKIALQHKDFKTARGYLQQAIKIDPKQMPAYYLLANVESRSGDREAAIDAYQGLLKIDPNQLEALYMSGILQLDLGDLPAVEKNVAALLAKFPRRAEGERLKGMLLFRQAQYPEAVQALQSSLTLQPHILAYFFLGLSHYSQNQLEQALSQFQKALDLQPNFERARILVAMTLLKQKRIPDAIQAVEQVLKTNKNNAYAYNILGSALIATGEYDRGMEALQTATELDPSLADAFLKRGVFHLAKGDKGQGEDDLLKAIAAAPEVMSSRLMLVTYYLKQKNYPAAIKTLQEGMTGKKNDALLNNYLAAAYFAQKKPDLAVAALNQAKQVAPDYLTPYFNLASYFASQADYVKALEEYQGVLSVDIKNIKALLGVASLYSVQGMDDRLLQTFEQIEATDTEAGFIATTQFYLKGKDLQKGQATVTRGLTKYPSSKMLLELEGGLLLREKKFTEAESIYQRLAVVAPEQGHSMLVRLYLFRKDVKQAETLVSELLNSSPNLDYPYLLSAQVSLSQKDVDAALLTLQTGVKQVDSPVRLQMNIGQIYERTGKLPQAEKVYRNVIEKNPRLSAAYVSLGSIKERSGDKGGALDFYRNAVKYDQRNVMALNNLAYLLADNFGEHKEALNRAMGAYRLQPGDPRIMDTLAFVLLKNDKPEEAHTLLLKAYKLLPNVPTVALHLGMAKIAIGEKDAAKEVLQRVVDNGQGEDKSQAESLLETLR